MPKYIPINKESHQKMFWVRPTSLDFLSKEVVAPIYADEVAAAMHSMPVAFIERNGEFSLVAVLSVKPDENLFISRNGEWLASYMPFMYRSFPFKLIDTDDQTGKQVLCINENYISAIDEGEPFFENGEITNFIQKIFEREQRYHQNRQLTKNICKILAENDLIIPWNIMVDAGDGEKPLVGLFRVDEIALNALSEDGYLALRRANALAVVYAHLLSLSKINVLSARLPAISPESRDSTNETFNFSGL